MPRVLADVVLGKNTSLLQEQLSLFCRRYQNCFGVDGAMDTARRAVFEASRQLVAQARPSASITGKMLADTTQAELQVMDVREQISGLNTDALHIIEAIKLKVKAFIMTLVQHHGHEQEDRQKLLEAFHIRPHTVQSQQQDTQMADLLTTEELRYLDQFVTSNVSDPAHNASLEELTKQITARVCQSVMGEVAVPDEVMTDPIACFSRHLERWQSTVAQVHEQREKLEKMDNDQRQLQQKIDSADRVLVELNKLREMSAQMCNSLQAEIKAPSAFHRMVSYVWHFGGKSKAVQAKEKKLELQLEATRRIGELIDTVNKTLAEAKAEQENPIDLGRILHKLDEVDGLTGNANESLRKVKEDLKAYEAAAAERTEAHANSFSYRWGGAVVVAAVTLTTGVAEAAVKSRMGLT